MTSWTMPTSKLIIAISEILREDGHKTTIYPGSEIIIIETTPEHTTQLMIENHQIVIHDTILTEIYLISRTNPLPRPTTHRYDLSDPELFTKITKTLKQIK